MKALTMKQQYGIIGMQLQVYLVVLIAVALVKQLAFVFAAVGIGLLIISFKLKVVRHIKLISILLNSFAIYVGVISLIKITQ